MYKNGLSRLIVLDLSSAEQAALHKMVYVLDFVPENSYSRVIISVLIVLPMLRSLNSDVLLLNRWSWIRKVH